MWFSFPSEQLDLPVLIKRPLRDSELDRTDARDGELSAHHSSQDAGSGSSGILSHVQVDVLSKLCMYMKQSILLVPIGIACQVDPSCRWQPCGPIFCGQYSCAAGAASLHVAGALQGQGAL